MPYAGAPPLPYPPPSGGGGSFFGMVGKVMSSALAERIASLAALGEGTLGEAQRLFSVAALVVGVGETEIIRTRDERIGRTIHAALTRLQHIDGLSEASRHEQRETQAPHHPSDHPISLSSLSHRLGVSQRAHQRLEQKVRPHEGPVEIDEEHPAWLWC